MKNLKTFQIRIGDLEVSTQTNLKSASVIAKNLLKNKKVIKYLEQLSNFKIHQEMIKNSSNYVG